MTHILKTCVRCEEKYCVNCSDAGDSTRFCSDDCEQESLNEASEPSTRVPYGDRYVVLP